MRKFVKRKWKKIKRKYSLIKLKLEGDKYKKWYGSAYGGFFVREEILKNREQIIVYSCGVGKDISFDVEIMRKYKQSKIFAFDPTPISINWIKNRRLPKNFFFFPVGISDKNGTEKMYFPKNFAVSYGVFSWDKENQDEIMVEMKTIEKIAEEHGHKFIDILKMDIEGSEFVVINSLDLTKIQFGQILVEFHERFLEDGSKVLKKTIAYLEANGYECFAVSDDFEYSFVNKRFNSIEK
jgi:FkbM family methyltransferase